QGRTPSGPGLRMARQRFAACRHVLSLLFHSDRDTRRAHVDWHWSVVGAGVPGAQAEVSRGVLHADRHGRTVLALRRYCLGFSISAALPGGPKLMRVYVRV